jgi:hypothetical protein
MNWNPIGASIYLIGAFGVIVSLFYVARQIRHNTDSVRAAGYQTVANNMATLSLAIGLQAGAATTLTRAQTTPDGLTPDEIAQSRWLWISLFRNYESIYQDYDRGLLDADVWEGWKHAMTRLYWSPGVQTWWPSWRNDCSAAFRSYIEGSTPPDDLIAELPEADWTLGE